MRIWLRRTLAVAVTLAGAGAGPAARAVDRLVLTAGQVVSPAASLAGVTVSLDLASGRAPGSGPAFTARIQRLVRPGLPALTGLQLSCARLRLDPRDFACRGGALTARASAIGPLSAALSVDFEPGAQLWKIAAARIPLAAGRAQITGTLRPGSLSIGASAVGVDLQQAARIVHPWMSLPAGYRVSGHLGLRLALSTGAAPTLQVEARSADLNVSNAPGTVVAQQVTASLSGTLAKRDHTLTLDAIVRGSQGQALAGPVLLDFGANPLLLSARLARNGNGPVVVSQLSLEQRQLLSAQATGVVQPAAHPGIVSAHLHIASLRFPAAYTSYLQLALAAGGLGSLQTSGRVSGSIDIARDALTRLDCSLHDVNFNDPDARVLMQHASGEIHWAAASGAALAPSEIRWQRAAAYGLSGGPVRLQFATWGRSFALLGGDTRLPLFDGAIVVHTLVGRDLGTSAAKLDFDADVTPISMPLVSKAFGWPVMSGVLSGRIPLVRYRDHDLTFDGDLVAKVFDGTIVGSHIVLEHPLGQWPSLSADVQARGLDLDLVTHTFAFGSMTGRVNVDVNALQLFDWSPVAFDARLYTMPGDRSPHRVSQNAVTRIASLGGGGGAVTAALESGVLRFFHTFHYDRIAIGCRLRNEVCAMSGAGPAPDGGYYLVKGSGVPRLDIIGNVHSVDWPRLIAQVAEGMRERDFKVSTGGK